METKGDRRSEHGKRWFDRSSWLAYLETIVSVGTDGTTRLRGGRLSATQTRAVHRWRQEGARPSLLSADRFLIASDINVNEYFIYCTEQGLPAWDV